MINDYDDLNVVDIPDLPEEFSQEFLQREIQKEIMKNWTSLKDVLDQSVTEDEVKQQIKDFDKLLRYWL